MGKKTLLNQRPVFQNRKLKLKTFLYMPVHIFLHVYVRKLAQELKNISLPYTKVRKIYPWMSLFLQNNYFLREALDHGSLQVRTTYRERHISGRTSLHK